MKKILLILLAGWLPWAASAQENKEEKVAGKATKEYLPKQGDWAVGMDVIPLLKYAGTIFSKKESELNHLGGKPFSASGKLDELFGDNKTLMPDVSIMGKYFLTDNFALRANIGLKISSETKRYYVDDDKAAWQQSLNKASVVDNFRIRKNGVSIMLGGEYRKGNRRVQGVFGGGVLFAFMNDKVTCKYGNELTSINQRPTTMPVPSENSGTSAALRTKAGESDYGTDNLPEPGTPENPGEDNPEIPGVSNTPGEGNDSNNPAKSTPSKVASRPLTKFNKGADFYFGLTGSAGVEWFVAPKISLGAEVNLSLYYMFGKQTYLEEESYNATLGRVEKQVKLESPGNRGFYMATECLGGSLSLNFYF